MLASKANDPNASCVSDVTDILAFLHEPKISPTPGTPQTHPSYRSASPHDHPRRLFAHDCEETFSWSCLPISCCFPPKASSFCFVLVARGTSREWPSARRGWLPSPVAESRRTTDECGCLSMLLEDMPVDQDAAPKEQATMQIKRSCSPTAH